jgi:hypothetical protein
VFGNDLIGDKADNAHLTTVGRHAKTQMAPIYVHRTAHHGLALGSFPGNNLSIFGGQLATSKHHLGAGSVQVRENNQVCTASGRYSAPVVQVEVLARIQGGHSNGGDRVDPFGNGDPHHMVNVSLVQQVGRHAIIRAEAEAAAGMRVDDGQQVTKVARVGRLTQKDEHAQPQFMARLLHRGTLVVGADVGCDVSHQRFAI